MKRDDSIIDLAAVREATIRQEPYPFVVIDKFLTEGQLAAIDADFPQIASCGSYTPDAVPTGPSIDRLLLELDSPEFRSVIEEKFGVDLAGRPAMLTFRGQTGPKDGRIHADTPSKVITLLLYCNREWKNEGGRLRILRSRDDLDDAAAEVVPELGTAVIFKVTDNCWHGHYPYVGERRAIQLNYLRDARSYESQSRKHRISANVKKVQGWFRRR